jgi:hypothetical protein
MSKTYADFMVAIEPVLDGLLTTLDRREIGDPYNLEQLAATSAKNGLGFKVGAGTLSTSSSYKTNHTNQEFTIVLTENGAIQSKASSVRSSVSKLHTDATTVIKTVSNMDWEPGVLFVALDSVESPYADDSNAFYALPITFTVKLIDDI